MTRIVAIVAAVALAVAILPLPYGYYQVLRLGIFAAGLYCGIKAKSAGNDGLGYCLFFTALVFNPFLPIYLSREIWLPLDLLSAALFGFTAYSFPKTSSGPQQET
ncbi:hypothetical protein SAMN04488498_103132 [Mesorhizobium albiziae]|uniref:Uncharacterized protein n=1 Tax=Neomesorhizobium albiziae TaxID=335020 RepID=A0A1I3XCT1_9HYPH|nr:DUF6804 family protein [Mesorhizobium albiziae]GLS30552.1 hypothetical protein GCM10007937_22600 [Mesorhizobium albiziae]SFK17149.1 hypothetical protein SAMN04488498_103132 [Mesorhizobium albiziae]